MSCYSCRQGKCRDEQRGTKRRRVEGRKNGWELTKKVKWGQSQYSGHWNSYDGKVNLIQ